MANKKNRKPGWLSDLDLSEVSLVDSPANQHSHVVLFKRDDHMTEEEALEEAEKRLKESDSVDARHEALGAAIQDLYGSREENAEVYTYIRRVFKKNVVFTVTDHTIGETKMYRAEYMVDSEGGVRLSPPVEVEIVYVDKLDEDDEQREIDVLAQRILSLRVGALLAQPTGR